MNTYAWLGLLLLANVTLFWLPLVPAMREWRRQGSEPLFIPTDDEAGTDYFAERFRQRLIADWHDPSLFAPVPPDATPAIFPFAEAARALALPLAQRYKVSLPGQLVLGDAGLRDQEQPVLVGSRVELAQGSNYLGEIYARDALVVSAGSVVRAALCDGELHLGNGCGVVRWAHARLITVGSGCRLGGRLSAGDEIHIGAGCRFERLSAPRIVFGNGATGAVPVSPRHSFDPTGMPGVEWQGDAGRWLCAGDVTIEDGSSVEGDLIVNGNLRIGAGCVLARGAKAHGSVTIADGTHVHGAVFAHGSIQIGNDCTLAGPISSSRDIRLGAGCTIGTQDRPASLAAPIIAVEGDCICHGSLWARSNGTTQG